MKYKVELSKYELKLIIEALIFSNCGDACYENTETSKQGVLLAEQFNNWFQEKPELNVYLNALEQDGKFVFDDENSELARKVISQIKVK
jgi:hypothetical protein